MHQPDPLFAALYPVFTARFYQPAPDEAARYAELAERGYIGVVAHGKLSGYEIRPAGRSVIYDRIYGAFTEEAEET